MSETNSINDVFPVFIKLPREKIAQLKFTLEGYEGLGILRTLDSDRGEVVILALEDTHKTVTELISTLKAELDLRIIPPPDSVRNDWLIGEAVKSRQ